MRDVTDKPEETPAPPPQVTTSVRPELSAPTATSTTAPTAPADATAAAGLDAAGISSTISDLTQQRNARVTRGCERRVRDAQRDIHA